MKNSIYVIYIDIRNIDGNLVDEYSKNVATEFKDSFNNGGTLLVIPYFNDTKIECINPKYITNENLIKEHEELMKKLTKNITIIIKETLNEKD